MLDDDDIKDTELSQGADDAEADFTPEAFEPEEKHEDKTVTEGSKTKEVVMFNLKFFKSLKEALDTKANLLTFASSQRKANEEYIESLSSNELKIKADEQRLEAMVRQQLKEEFPNIEKSSSYDLLVDAVIHNYKSKQLQATDGAEIN